MHQALFTSTKLKLNLEKDDLERLDPNSLTDKIILCIQDAINSTFPLKKVSRKEARKISNPWMTNEILSEIKTRDNLKKFWIKSGHVQNTPEHVAYKASRNLVVKMTRIAKKQDSLNECKNAKGDGDKIWRAIRKATNTAGKPNITPNFIKVPTADGGHEKIQDKTEIANKMNQQFCQMGANLANELSPTTANFSDYLPFPNPNQKRFILHPAF